jgi:hypothetical protein
MAGVAALDESEDGSQVEQTNPSDLARLTNASARNLVLGIELVEFRSTESGKVFRSRFRCANPHWKHSLPVV